MDNARPREVIHGSAYTRRTKLLARKENESRYSPESPGNHRNLQLRPQLQNQVRDEQAGVEGRSLLRMPPVLHRHAKDCGYRRPHRQIPPEIWHQSCCVGTLRNSLIKRQRLLPFLFAATIPSDIQRQAETLNIEQELTCVY